MLLREALQKIASARLSSTRRVALLCSFEPLHLESYLQAALVQRQPDETPQVVRFGYDQLREGLARTAEELRASPALLILSWDNLHPALSWRSRAPLKSVSEGDLLDRGRVLEDELVEWLEARRGAESYVVLPPLEWLPLHDACPPAAIGPIQLTATALLQEIVRQLDRHGARMLRVSAMALNYRELMQAGCPLTLEDCETVSRRFIEAAYPSGRKKAVVADLDGTLWSGVMGEDGAEGIRCRPEGQGAFHWALQQMLAKLKAEGIWVAFCSKNNLDDVLPVFDALEMPLKLADFAAFRCNWESKADNLLAIARELNIGWEDVVVIDDNPAELSELRARLPAVTALQVPREGADWPRFFEALQALCGTWRVSEEDQLRAFDAPAAKRAMEPPAASDGTLRHLRELELRVTINRAALAEARSLELINKTNQFNLTGERIDSEEWLRWTGTSEVVGCSAKLRDRFGDFGTIGVVTGRAVDETTFLVRQFVLSCRAFGRGAEVLLLGDLLQQGGWTRLRGPFRSTGKNEPVRQFLARFGCALDGTGEWEISREALEAAVRRILEETAAHVSIVDTAKVVI